MIPIFSMPYLNIINKQMFRLGRLLYRCAKQKPPSFSVPP